MIQYIEGRADWPSIRVGITAARWNSMITDEMVEGAISALKSRGVLEKNILVTRCPGSFEIPLGCKQLLEYCKVDGVVAIGAVIRGETPHFDYICEAVSRSVMELNLAYTKPVAFGVLTTNTVEQAVQRASTGKGNKGSEAALALCDMIALDNTLRSSS